MNKTYLEKLFGVRYLKSKANEILGSVENDAYTYKSYVGEHRISVEQGDSLWFLERAKGKLCAHVANGPVVVESKIWATIIRGYRVYGDKSVEITLNTILPYVNGCSTAQLFPPDRAGDPTLQLLKIPPFAAEQAHHIHSTVRLVYVLDGYGYSIVGMRDKHVKQKLTPGMLIVLQKMAPHHFETESEWLTVAPLHVFSALPNGLESNHPMFNGTVLTNHGK